MLEVAAEISIDSEPCVIAWDNKLFVGTDKGTIKSFHPDLSPGETWMAHETQLFALAAAEGKVYSSSYDGGIKVWSSQGNKIAEILKTGAEISVLRFSDKYLYSGDEVGNVCVYENNKEKVNYYLLEEVKDLAIRFPYLFTVRDLDVTVTEINLGTSKNCYVMMQTFEGRAPLQVTGTYLLAMARDGNHLRLHDASIPKKLRKLHEVKISDMIVTSLSAVGDYVWTAGWDGQIQRWKITMDSKLEFSGKIDLGACINEVVATAPNIAYGILVGGKIVCVKAT